jgi:hypothetical protein
MWAAAEDLALRAPDLEALRLHRLELLAGRALARRGRPVPADLRAEALRAAAAALAVPVLLARVRAACDGPLVLMKGPEVGAHYPDPALRPCKDLDLLVEDAVAAQRALRAAGFVPTGDPRLYEGIHHLRPLALPGLPLTIEIHARAKWPDRMLAPPTEALLEGAVASATGVAGILAPAPAHHAVLLAAHAWAHEPLGSAGRLLDVAALGADPAEADALARRWGCRRVWRHTHAAATALMEGGSTPALRLWARHLAGARERTVLENHLTRLAGEAWGLPRGRTVPATAAALARSAGRARGEPWRQKLGRTRGAIADAFLSRSEHDRRAWAVQPIEPNPERRGS